MVTKNVSKKLLNRLPVYLHYIKALPENTVYISATRMAKELGLGDVMVRKDLAKVSDGGRRKLGYARKHLMADIEKFLDVNSTWDAVLVGVGKLGQALLDYDGFEADGLRIVAGFDICPAGEPAGSKKAVYPMAQLAQFCKDNRITVAILTVPAGIAQQVCDELVGCGIRALWNFSAAHLRVPEHVVVQSENFSVSLTALRMQLKARNSRNAFDM